MRWNILGGKQRNQGCPWGGVGIRVVLPQPCSWKHFFSLPHPKSDVGECFQLKSGLKSLPMPLAGGAGCDYGLPRPPGTRKEASSHQDFLWRARKGKVWTRSRGWEVPPGGRWCRRGAEPFVPGTSPGRVGEAGDQQQFLAAVSQPVLAAPSHEQGSRNVSSSQKFGDGAGSTQGCGVPGLALRTLRCFCASPCLGEGAEAGREL